MPFGNDFRHQQYTAEAPRTPYELVSPPVPDQDLSHNDTALSCVVPFQQRGPQAVVLVHGTFAGDDNFGLIRGLERLIPAWGDRLRSLGKQLLDEYVGQAGNYVPEYERAFQQLVDPDARSIVIQRWCWSGENHHLGRAEAALGVLGQLAELVASGRTRILLWGHSHAGNVFALVTNLLAGSPRRVGRFFRILRPDRSEADKQTQRWTQWLDARRWVLSGAAAEVASRLDIVTFGTPIRYGWETGGYRRLLHFVHHRPAPGLAPYRVPFPVGWDDLVQARYGDYVQQLGLAGTNFVPIEPNWSQWRREYRLSKLLAGKLSWRNTVARLRTGQRVPDEGDTLLVDYPPYPDQFQRLLLGHAIYTHSAWLPFHVREVTRRFYGDE